MPTIEPFLQQHSGELTILVLSLLLFGTLLVLIPQLLRSHQKTLELTHEEHLRALEKGQPLPRVDERSLFAGRTALLVPIVSICTAGTVTCFLVAYRSEIIFSVALAVWTVAGIISLAAITGCVTLLARLAQVSLDGDDETAAAKPPEKTL
jgi:hypothetical protein